MNNKQFDKWLAEKVMDWQRVGYGYAGPHAYKHYGWYTKTGGMVRHDVDKWNPTTSESDAFMVVDALINKDFIKHSFYLRRLMFAPAWCCQIGTVEADAETRTLAICLAAKRVIEKRGDRDGYHTQIYPDV